jgi:pimeloyl-ACP methyl ester carboxylesterase
LQPVRGFPLFGLFQPAKAFCQASLRLYVAWLLARFVPEDLVTAPRDWAESFFDVRRWTEMPRGGHFAAMEEPELLAEDIGAFFRPLR